MVDAATGTETPAQKLENLIPELLAFVERYVLASGNRGLMEASPVPTTPCYTELDPGALQHRADAAHPRQGDGYVPVSMTSRRFQQMAT